jgi:hypothetical protein
MSLCRVSRAGLVALAASLAGCGGNGDAPNPEEALLRRQVSGLQALVAAAEKGPLVPFEHVLVVVDERLVQDLLLSTTPYERIVGGRFRVRVDSAAVQFSHGFALVRLEGRASFVDQDVSADVRVYSGLDVVELDPSSGTLRARANVFAVEVPRVQLLGSERGSWRLAEELGKEQLDSYGALLSAVEVPVRIEQEIEIPGVRTRRVSIAAAELPISATVSDVKAFEGKLWITVQGRVGGVAEPPPAQVARTALR